MAHKRIIHGTHEPSGKFNLYDIYAVYTSRIFEIFKLSNICSKYFFKKSHNLTTQQQMELSKKKNNLPLTRRTKGRIPGTDGPI